MKSRRESHLSLSQMLQLCGLFQDPAVIESKNHFGWKILLGSPSPTVNLAKPSPPCPQTHVR